MALRRGAVLYDQLGGRTYNNLLIDVGESGDAPFLTAGWYDRERTPDISFRWSAGPTSSLVVPLKEPADYLLELRCAAFSFPGAPDQAAQIAVNGTVIGALRMQPGFTEQEVAVPAALLRANLNRIVFRYAYTQSPRDAGLGDDARELAVECDWIRLTRQ
jgi:hypothetical protein